MCLSGLVSVRGANTVDPPPNYVSALQCLGPLCRCADDLVPIFKVILGEKAEKLKLDQQVQVAAVSKLHS